MGFVSYTTCDICGERIDDRKNVEDGEVSISGGRVAITMCVRCQQGNTVFAAKEYLRRYLKNQTKGPPVMPNNDNDPNAPTETTADTGKAETVEELRAKIAEIEGKDQGERDEGDTPTKPKAETHNKFGVNTRDGGIIVGNNLALVNGVSVADAINLAAWLNIVADRGLTPRATIENAELFDTIVEANPQS